MPLVEQFDHFGYRKIFPFLRFGDASTAWIQKRYQIDQAYFEEKPIAETKLNPGDRIFDLEPKLIDKDPWLLEQTPRILFPGRLQVTETYGYLPPPHEYPGVVTFDFPGIEDDRAFGTRTIETVGSVSGGRVQLTLGAGFTIEAGDLVIVNRPPGRVVLNTWYALTSLPTRVTNVAGDIITLAGITFTTSGGGTVSTNPVSELHAVANYGGTATVRAFKRIKPARTETVSALFRREYLRYLPDSYVRRISGGEEFGGRQASPLPLLIPKFQVLTAAGEVTDVIENDTSPTVTEWNDLIANREPVVVETSRLGQEMGDIWYRETPYITITE